MSALLPHRLDAILAQVGPHDRLPLTDADLDDRMLGWARIRMEGDVDPIKARLQDAGCRVGIAQRWDRRFVLARTGQGDRLEIDVVCRDPVTRATDFAEALDRAILARRAGSSIACWLAMNDAIVALLRHVTDASGDPGTLEALPKARARMPKHLRDRLRDLRTGLNLRETLGELRECLAFARSLAEWLGTRAGVELAEEVEALAPILEADRFWNLRDVALWWAPFARAGVLWRGKPPATYASEGFWSFAERAGLRRYVDLRGAQERLEDAYPADFEGCASCPLGRDPRAEPRAAQASLVDSYRSMPLRAAAALGAVLTAIAETDGPTLLHCRAGVDRTGVVVALVGMWLGVPRERIVADYLASGQLVESRRLAIALEVAEAQGIDRMIASTGLPGATLETARRRLLP